MTLAMETHAVEILHSTNLGFRCAAMVAFLVNLIKNAVEELLYQMKMFVVETVFMERSTKSNQTIYVATKIIMIKIRGYVAQK